MSVYGTVARAVMQVGFSRGGCTPLTLGRGLALPSRSRASTSHSVGWWGPRPPSPPCPRGQHGNVHPFPIGFGTRLRLRHRLTLIRLAWIRNPWPFGAPVFHRRYRYSCLHLLFPALHRPARAGFYARGMLPYHAGRKPGIQSLGGALDARSLSMHGRSTSELLRTL